MQTLIVHKGRTVKVPVSLGYDVSADTLTSQIREGESQDSELIAEWVVTYETDGTDGEVILTLDDAVTGAITQAQGYMDMKRVIGGEPTNVFDKPLMVIFQGTVTA